jgi:undecaprenyl-diphosphatase
VIEALTLEFLGEAVILGLVEGVTEFLPVSSTGHLIVVGQWLGQVGERANTFHIFIQLGAILAIVWLYRVRLAQVVLAGGREGERRHFFQNLIIGFLPAASLGFVTHEWIKRELFNPTVVAIALIVGGIVILLIERWPPRVRVDDLRLLPPRTALGIGMAQVLALVPGTSRSGATILGGYALGLSRTAATEFSFFLAIPVMIAATLFDLLDSWSLLTPGDIPFFAVGFLVSFLSALVVVKALLTYVSRHSFAAFAWYRIAFGMFLLLIT